jgi:hypothetical protein
VIFIVRKAILFRHLQHESRRQSFFIDSAIFAHSDKVQSALKPIAYNKKQNEALWHKMNERALALVQKLNFLILFPMKVRNKAILLEIN